MKPTLCSCMVWVVAAGLCVSCRPAAEIQPTDIRTYTVPRPAGGAARAAGSTARPSSGPSTSAPAGGPTVAYDLPEGWQDKGASGMRLATLRTGPDTAADAAEITIIPASGSLEGNAARWQEQLTPGASSDRVAQAIEQAEKVSVNGTEATILLLTDDAAENRQAILAAMIPLDASTSLFVKFKGPAALAGTLREPFTGFVRSIRWK
jgi:hypothetical protein